MTSSGHTTSHNAGVPIVALDDSLPWPELFLRHYRGSISMVSGQLLFTGSTILPDSFRHAHAKNLSNPRITRVSREFAHIPKRLQPKVSLDGTYYVLDSAHPGHFGHLMTEVLSRLWGWVEAKQMFPDLKLLISMRRPNGRSTVLETRLLTAFGIAPSDIVCADRPVSLRSVVGATPMWHNHTPHYVHPQIKPRVWDRIATNLVDRAGEGDDKIFVSRQVHQKRRNCRNARQVEDLFSARGFRIVYPELLDIGEQATVFAKARVIAGFAGSAMFNVMFAREVETFVVLAHESYTARNEHLFAAALGCDVHYFWSTPDIPHPERGWTEDAFYSDWEFDFARNADELNALLDTA